MTQKEMENALAKTGHEIRDLKEKNDRLFGELLGLAACFSASQSSVTPEDARMRLKLLAGADPIPDAILEYAERAIRHILNQILFSKRFFNEMPRKCRNC